MALPTPGADTLLFCSTAPLITPIVPVFPVRIGAVLPAAPVLLPSSTRLLKRMVPPLVLNIGPDTRLELLCSVMISSIGVPERL